MNPVRFSRDGILAIACAGLGLALFLFRSAPPADYHIPDSPPQTLAPLDINAPSFEVPQRSEFDLVDVRFLFNPARLAYVPPPEPVEEPPPPEPPQISLVGIIAEGASRLAMVRDPAEPYAVGLRVGTNIGGWKVSEISDEFITLSVQSLEHRVVLNTGSGQNNGN